MLMTFALIYAVQGVSFIIGGKSAAKCFMLFVEEDQEVAAAYVVSGKNDLKVRATLVNPQGVVEFANKVRTREGKMESKSRARGYYRLCFQSEDPSRKTVAFDFFIVDKMLEESFARQEEFSPLRTSFRKLSRNLDMVYRNMQFYERREKTHRDLAEATCDRVLRIGILKMLVLGVISSFQAWLIISLLNNKSGSSI